MSDADIIYLSTLASTMIGTFIVPTLVAIIVRQTWNKEQKRWTAWVISCLVGLLQWFVQYYTVDTGTPFSLAVSLPIIFGLSTASYNIYWKEKLGPLEAIDTLAKIGIK